MRRYLLLLLIGFALQSLFAEARGQQLQMRRDEEKALLAKQEKIQEELEEIIIITQHPPATMPSAEKDRLLRRSQMLNAVQDTISTRLKDIAREIRETEHGQVASVFNGPCDVYMDSAELGSGKPSIVRAHFDQRMELENRRLVRLKTDKGWWIIDPAKVVAVRSSPTTQPAAGEL